MIKFIIFFLLLAIASAERNTLCDDGEPVDVSCHVNPPETLSDLVCGRKGLLALQSGCFLCVDASTCVALGSALNLNGEEQKNGLPMPKANGNDISVLLQDQADHSPEESAFEQANANPNLVTQRQDTHKLDVVESPEISNWLFSIPVGFAIVSLGLAVRSRVSPRRHGFKRLQDNREQKKPLFQEDINPFCSNEDDNMAIETAGHFQGDPSNSESEEGQFLAPEIEDDGLTQAESKAIKEAVLLHIKEFDEEEAEI
ncbi:hypothetical protein P3T76_013691 [Phytophthora citrophthora]|uniref:Uncharacterized protein n=1 Tax=Phytophthora citrophthora TaxID=4793 RepID=A0AAD9G2A2_9STRA|nr:hypothetical protein P3T76_013691 [Phytophthora citrophthora]